MSVPRLDLLLLIKGGCIAPEMKPFTFPDSVVLSVKKPPSAVLLQKKNRKSVNSRASHKVKSWHATVTCGFSPGEGKGRDRLPPPLVHSLAELTDM